MFNQLALSNYFLPMKKKFIHVKLILFYISFNYKYLKSQIIIKILFLSIYGKLINFIIICLIFYIYLYNDNSIYDYKIKIIKANLYNLYKIYAFTIPKKR